MDEAETIEVYAERYARQVSIESGVLVTGDEVLRALRRAQEVAEADREWQRDCTLIGRFYA